MSQFYKSHDLPAIAYYWIPPLPFCSERPRERWDGEIHLKFQGGWFLKDGGTQKFLRDDSKALMSVFLSLEKQGRAVLRQERKILFSRDTVIHFTAQTIHTII